MGFQLMYWNALNLIDLELEKQINKCNSLEFLIHFGIQNYQIQRRFRANKCQYSNYRFLQMLIQMVFAIFIIPQLESPLLEMDI